MTNEAENPEMAEPEEEFSWDLFIRDLRDYVRLELAGQDAATHYAEWAFQINTSVECRDAYLRELHRQSLDWVDDRVRQQVQQLLQPSPIVSPISPAANWLDRTIADGRAWLDASTQRWRQVQISLADLHFGPTNQSAVAGLMSDETPAGSGMQGTLQVAPPDSGFELTIAVSADLAATDPNLYQAEIMVTLLDRFGNYSGVDLYLLWDDVTRQTTTDAFGRARFTGLPAAQVKAMSLTVVFPDDDAA